jgi:hypothetical protein
MLWRTLARRVVEKSFANLRDRLQHTTLVNNS